MEKHVMEYQKFTKFIKETPTNLKMGRVVNSISAGSEFVDEHETDVTRSIKCLLDSSPQKTSRVYSYNHYSCEKPKITRYGRKLKTSDLKNMASPAPYGDTISGVTKVNAKVRKCLHITNNELEKNNVIVGCIPDHVCDMVQANMYPGKNIDFILNKINIYEKDGFFVEHTDTPKPGVIGTLVFIWSEGRYDGGELVLNYGDSEEIFEEGIVAFYTNIRHRIEPVKGNGARISATYYIIDDFGQDPEASDSAVDTDVDSLNVLNIHAPFGLILRERYSQSETSCKGIDADLEKILINSNLFKFECYPVIVNYTEKYDDDDCECEIECDVYRCTIDDYQDPPSEPIQEYKFYELDEFNRSLKPSDGCPEPILNCASQPYVEYVGNECQEGLVNNIYFSRAMIVKRKIQSNK